MARQAEAASIAVRVRVLPPVPVVLADRDHLKQVLLVTIEAQAVRDRVAIVVADTGPGIPPERLARVFDPYFTTKGNGLGLGLTIARRIVEAHGGSIEVESGPGRGTRFRVWLPAAPR